MEQIKLFWGTITNESLVGNLYGYRVHNETLRKYVEMREDIKIVDKWEDADCALYITTPEVFEFRPPIPTFLFTMFEGTTLPEIYLKNIKKVDFLITPSRWVKDVFIQYFDANKIFIVPHGVESIFKFRERKVNPNHFRYLWVGAANPRKGYQELIYLWGKLKLDFNPKVELYIKTTRVPNTEIKQCKNVILDSRNLSKEDLVDLYYQAHCFVFPTRGEGFGLTLAEAMATGLPCIATGCSGETEFFDESVGYPLKYKMGESPVTSWIHGSMGNTIVAYPDVTDLAEKMIMIRNNYKKALLKGKAASIRIKTKFTWENSAQRLFDALSLGLRGN